MPIAPLRLGVVSFAHGHINLYLEAMRAFDDAVVVAGWDADRTCGEAQCAKHG